MAPTSLEIGRASGKELGKVVHIGRFTDDSSPNAWRGKGDILPMARNEQEALRSKAVEMNAPFHNVSEYFWDSNGMHRGGNGG